MIKFYNSLTRKKEEFKPIIKNSVGIYSCGPTVYNFVHIGNLRAYVFSDILVKTLRYFNFKVKWVMNITDVDDKTIRDSKKEIEDLNLDNLNLNQILKKFTERYKNFFLEDLENMNIVKPNSMPSAVNSIKDMEFLIQKLTDNGFTYIGDDGIYFNLSKYKDYGKLVNIDFNSQKKNSSNRLIDDEYDKENLADFVLWKFKKENEPYWKINISGKEYLGRPGWHIECSAMSFSEFGEKFDIHTGGVDLKFPHHENEICQSKCALNLKGSQANYWMHNEHLLVDGKKMSKSLGNFYTLRDLIKKGFFPLAVRELFLRSHYRQQLNFTMESLKAGEVNIKKINDFYIKFKNLKPNLEENSQKIKQIFESKLDKFELALKDDLNTPVAIASLYEFMNEINKINSFSREDIDLILQFIERTNKIFSLLKNKSELIPESIILLAEKRKDARNEKNWQKADEFRNEINKLGFEIKDDKNVEKGYILTKII